MPHPIHDILLKWLGTEQSSFDTGSYKYWPWEDSSARYDAEAPEHGSEPSDATGGYGEPQPEN